jgi:hypothetical protein
VQLKRVTNNQRVIRFGLLLMSGSLLALLTSAASHTFRDVDQAGYVNGAIRLAHGEIHLWAAPLFNYDKEYGTYLLLASVFRIFPQADPVQVSNILNFLLFATATLAVSLSRKGNAGVRVLAFAPVIMSPALALYAPFFGSSCLSYSVLVCAFMAAILLPKRGGKLVAALLVFFAVACRADAILALPAFILSLHSRQRIANLIKDRFVWTLGGAGVLAMALGKVIFRGGPMYFAGFMGFATQLKASIALIVLAFGLGECVLLVLLLICYSMIIAEKKRARSYYVLATLSLIVPIAFYSVQLLSPTFFFPQLAATLFCLSSRRTAVIWRYWHQRRYDISTALVTISAILTIAPWFVGLQLGRLSKPRITLLQPTLFPTSHGAFPMGAYGPFIWELRWHDFLIDHNQRIWESARTVAYRACGNNEVGLVYSPMVSYLELAVRLQGRNPIIVKNWKNGPCGFVYVDSRSAIRRVSPLSRTAPDLRSMLGSSISLASQGDDGDPILMVDVGQPQSAIAAILSQLREVFGGRDFRVVFLSGNRETIKLIPAYKYALFSDGLSCHMGRDGRQMTIAGSDFLKAVWDGRSFGNAESATLSCSQARIVGWAQSALPDYLYY